MQNEELQRVFNISELPNHRYNGFVLPVTEDKYSIKAKKSSPKPKKHAGLDMVTSSGKPFVKRKPRVKSCINKSRDSVIVNGINTVNNVLPNQKEFNSLAEKYRSNNLNNFNKSYEPTDVNSVESISSILSSLSNDLNSNPGNRVRLANPLKYADNHSRNSEATSSGIICTKNFTPFNTESELKLKTNHVNNFTPKFNSPPATSKTKLTELRKKDEELPLYSPEIATVKSIVPNNQLNEKLDVRFVDRSKVEKEPDKKVVDSNSNKLYENKLFLRAKKRKQNRSKWQMDNGTRHEALQRIRTSLELHENLRNDLFPLNIGETVFEKSESDSSDDYNSTFQNNWFHGMAGIEFDDVKRSFRLGQLYNELRRQCCQIKQNKSDVPIFTEKFMKSLIDTARTRPMDVVRCLEEQEQFQTSMSEPVILAKKKCALENCKNVSLPCMPTCVRHIIYCEKQTLFEQCRVRESNDVQCDKPVLNIRYNYPVCSLHSKSNLTLPDFTREDIKYEDVRNKNTSSTSDIYKIDFDLTNTNFVAAKPSITTSSKLDVNKKKNHTASTSTKTVAAVRPTQPLPDKVEKVEKKFEKPDVKYTKNGELERKPNAIESNQILRKEEPKPANQTMPAANPNLLRDWVSLSDNQLVDAKTLENTLQNEFVNGFDINSSTIQSQIQDIINSESTLSPDMLMGTDEIPNYIQVEEMIEEVEITDEGELNNTELVHSEDLNAVLKQLPPEAFNELFSDKNDSHWGETQALERVIEEMDVRKCPLIDPSLLLEDIEPSSYANYTNNFDGNALAENVESRFSDLTPENCSQSQS